MTTRSNGLVATMCVSCGAAMLVKSDGEFQCSSCFSRRVDAIRRRADSYTQRKRLLEWCRSGSERNRSERSQVMPATSDIFGI